MGVGGYGVPFGTGEGVVAGDDFAEDFGSVGAVEGYVSAEESVEDDSDAPEV